MIDLETARLLFLLAWCGGIASGLGISLVLYHFSHRSSP